MKTIAYQGMPGSFSHLTALRELGKEANFLGKNTFKDVFKHLDNQQVEFALLPIENSLIGTIYENYDMMNAYPVAIAAEYYTKISHCLLTCAQKGVDNVKRVYSHPKALEQCKDFFATHPWIEAVSHVDTAGAAADIAKWKDPSYAAIASKQCAEIYHLHLLMDGIEDDPHNYTRFALITKSSSSVPHCDKANKCSLQLTLSHRSGTLARLLNVLVEHGMNLTKIESRPLVGKPFEYQFYLDFQFPSKKLLKQFLEELPLYVVHFKLLGIYKAGHR